MTDHASVYATFPDGESARQAARALLEEDLVACANLSPTESIYVWEGEIQDDDEVAAFFKTRADLADEVADRIARDHPYDVPCAVVFPLEGGHGPYLGWIDEVTGG